MAFSNTPKKELDKKREDIEKAIEEEKEKWEAFNVKKKLIFV